VVGRPNRRNKAAFSNSSGVLWMGLKLKKKKRKKRLNVYVEENKFISPIIKHRTDLGMK